VDVLGRLWRRCREGNTLVSGQLDMADRILQATPTHHIMHIYIALVAVVAALAECSRLTPPVLPLFVRNPYLSIWLPNVRQNQPWAYWPMFWTGESIGLSVLASLPGSSKVYPLLGRPQDSLSPNLYERISSGQSTVVPSS
jgi:hypothetical protein